MTGWTHQWSQLKAKFKTHCRMINAPCHLCVLRGDAEHAAIDYDAPANTARAFDADHYHPRSTHPQLAYEWSNLRASHVRCNRQRRDEPVPEPQVWVKPDW
ncbi:hypothetical protein A5647_24170 [Mycobacterium sp. 1100029.7]|nr:hypothetical protein A5647_24170 [Mycobacterium sp. 1100029.7]